MMTEIEMILELKKENAALKSKLAEAVRVLEYYGNRDNWEDDTKEFMHLMYGRGDYAREILQTLREEKEIKP